MKNVYDKLFNQVFSEFFTNKRKEKRYSRKDVAFFLKMNENTFTCYEKGTRDVPISVMKKLCKFYGIDFLETFMMLDKETTRRENG